MRIAIGLVLLFTAIALFKNFPLIATLVFGGSCGVMYYATERDESQFMAVIFVVAVAGVILAFLAGLLSI